MRGGLNTSILHSTPLVSKYPDNNHFPVSTHNTAFNVFHTIFCVSTVWPIYVHMTNIYSSMDSTTPLFFLPWWCLFDFNIFYSCASGGIHGTMGIMDREFLLGKFSCALYRVQQHWCSLHTRGQEQRPQLWQTELSL